MRRLLTLSVWFALATGVLELTFLAGDKWLLRKTLFVGQDVVWLAPVGYLLLFLGVGLVVSGLQRRSRRDLAPALVGGLGFLGSLSALFIYNPRVHALALLLTAIGVAIQGARVARHRPASLDRLVRRTLPILAGLPVLFAAILGWQRHRAERAGIVVAADRASHPNVLLIILDTVRAKSLSLYGYGRPTTPELERLASRGARFDRAIAPAPWTLPSHATMFTGQWPHALSANWTTPLDASRPTLAEVLRARGYATAGFVANAGYTGWESGLDRGFGHFEDYGRTLEDLIHSMSLGRAVTANSRVEMLAGGRIWLGRKDAARISSDFLGWLDQERDRPFFVFLNYLDAHGPYRPTPEFAARFVSHPTPSVAVRVKRAVGLVPRQMRDSSWARSNEEKYDALVAELDAEMGRLFAELDRRGLGDNTLVIITADHGEQFGEHRRSFHGNSLYRPLLHVPLVAWLAGRVPVATTVADAVTLRDLPATIMDLAGLGEHPFPGRSWSRYWDSLNPPAEEPVLAELSALRNRQSDMKAVIAGATHYIRHSSGREELFNMDLDPAELDDVAARPSSEAVLRARRSDLQHLTRAP